jgi:hypothetical protein
MTCRWDQERARRRRRYRAGGLAAIMLVAAAELSRAMAGPTVALAPHRAVYELSLDSSASGAAITAVRGRMVHEFTGGACEGYKVSMRWVAQMADGEGQVNIDDVRFVSWEDGEGGSYNYSSMRLQNDRVIEEVEASAERGIGAAAGSVALVKPKPARLDLPSAAIFPTTHMRRVIDAARAGHRFAEGQVYDVSEDGRDIYDTLAVITPLRRRPLDPAGDADLAGLDQIAGWRVRISYFDGAEKGDEVPSFEQTFELFANGVATELLLDYGDIVIKGTLTDLEFLAGPPCQGG